MLQCPSGKKNRSEPTKRSCFYLRWPPALVLCLLDSLKLHIVTDAFFRTALEGYSHIS
jgi:hypothetical protein